jgi:hypothetical protein
MQPEHIGRMPRFADMLTMVEAQQRTEEFLTGQMLQALRAVECQLPSFDSEPQALDLADAARAVLEIRHVRGASDANYMVAAFGDELLMQLQLNVHRLVVVYRVPGSERSMRTALRYISIVGASAPSMPGGNSAGGTRRSETRAAAAMLRHIAMRSPRRIFSKTGRSSSIGARTSL